MSRRTQQQLVNQRFADIQNNKAWKGFKWGFSDKTGWDWLDLIAKLAVPVILGVATLLLSKQQADLAQQQRLQDQASVLDQQRQAVLVKYQDDMKDLLLHTNLLTSKPSDEIRVIALTETLSAMRQLDAKRNTFLMQFLKNAHLNEVNLNPRESYNIVNFLHADLNHIDFSNTNLSDINLNGAELTNANLGSAVLINASLSGVDLDTADLRDTILLNANLRDAFLGFANLSGADLNIADLTNAILNTANLSGANLASAKLVNVDLDNANLRGADLGNADLTNAQLAGVDLSGANDLTQQQLDQVSFCKDTILPKGLTCHRNRNSSP